MVFYDFTSFFKVFINIHEYANKMIYISDHRKKGLCLSFNWTPRISSTQDRIDFVGLPPFLRIIKGLPWKPCIFTLSNPNLFRTTLFCIQGVPMNNLAPIRNCPGGCKVTLIGSRGIIFPISC